MAAPYKACVCVCVCVCGRSFAGIAGSNPAGGAGLGCRAFCECCVLSGRGLCDGPIPRPGEFYRVWCV